MKTILDEAAAIVDGDREQTYGDPGRNLRTIADLWDSWLLARGYSGPGLTTDDVAALMVLLKMARLANDPEHRDSQVDACGYLRLMERVQKHNSAQEEQLATDLAATLDWDQTAPVRFEFVPQAEHGIPGATVLRATMHEATDDTAGIPECDTRAADAEFLKQTAANLSYGTSRSEATAKHRLNEIAMRVSSGAYSKGASNPFSAPSMDGLKPASPNDAIHRED